MSLKITLTAIAFVTSFVFAFYFIKTQHSCTCLSDIIFSGITVDFTNNESKWFLVRNILLKLALFIFVHVTLVISLRVAARTTSPGTTPDPSQIGLVNKIITNTIEQSIVFFGFYVYYIFDGPYARLSSIQLLNLPTWFFCGRLLFSLGYIIGTIVDVQQLRGYGMVLTFVVNSLLAEQIFFPVQPVANFVMG